MAFPARYSFLNILYVYDRYRKYFPPVKRDLILFERVSNLVAHLDSSGWSFGVLRSILLNVAYITGAVLTLEMTFFNRFEFGTAFSALNGAGSVFRVSHI